MRLKTLLVVALTTGCLTCASAQITTRALNNSTAENASLKLDRILQDKGQKSPKAEEVGKLELLFKEDFSNMKKGSTTKPDMDNPVKDESISYVYQNAKPEFFTTKGPKGENWGVENAFSAGGAVALYGTVGRLTTPILNATKFSGGIVAIRFKIRLVEPMPADNQCYFGIQAAETRNMSRNGWTYLENYIMPNPTTEWQTYEYVFSGGGPSTMYNMGFESKSELTVLIDDLEVYYIDPFVSIPELTGHTDYTGKTFTLNWKPVEGATSYLVSLNKIVESTGPQQRELQEAIFTDREVKGANSFKVTDAESGAIYNYTVKAKKGDKVSLKQVNPTIIFDMEIPKAPENAAFNDDTSIKATWKAVPAAKAYNYYVLRKRVAEKDGPMVITNENYSDVLSVDDEKSGFTVDSPDPDAKVYHSQHYLKGVNQYGWFVRYGVPYSSYICLDAWHSFSSYMENVATLQSIPMDLSKDGGKFTLSVKYHGGEVEADTDQGKKMVPVWAIVALFTYDEQTGKYKQVESFRSEDIPVDAWKDYTYNFTKGTAKSIVGIFAVNGPTNLYVDNLKITQNYKAGDEFLDRIAMVPFTTETEATATIPEKWKGSYLLHQVVALRPLLKSNPNDSTSSLERYSEISEVHKGSTAILKPTNWEPFTYTYNKGCLVINNPEGHSIRVITPSGSLVAQPSNNKQITLQLAKGIYLIVSEGYVAKVAL